MIAARTMIFARLFEPISSTYTYLLGCEETGLAVLVDPVLPAWERDLAEVRARGLRLAYTLDTHIHADHITSALRLEPLHTPGHTDNHLSILCGDRVFTGDALLIDGCGRTDFQNGDARKLYRSVHQRLFTLPDATRVCPAHDYEGRRESTIAREREGNSRLGAGRSLEEFVAIMGALDLPYPRFIDRALTGNRLCGVCPEDLPEDLAKYCVDMESGPQG